MPPPRPPDIGPVTRLRYLYPSTWTLAGKARLGIISFPPTDGPGLTLLYPRAGHAGCLHPLTWLGSLRCPLAGGEAGDGEKRERPDDWSGPFTQAHLRT